MGYSQLKEARNEERYFLVRVYNIMVFLRTDNMVKPEGRHTNTE